MKRVLLVDDDINLCKVIGYQLQKNGFEVTSANRGNAALAYFQKQEFDIVITDIQMPDITGIQVLKAIRRRNRQVVIIIITAHGVTRRRSFSRAKMRQSPRRKKASNMRPTLRT